MGAGQAGLGVGFWLSRRSELSHLLVDAAPRLGQSWLDRWDSLALFTPRRFSGLPGRRFPSGASPYPSKDETAAYLADYAREHDLPVRLEERVERLTRNGAGFLASTSGGTVRARHVVIAAGPFTTPYVPAAAAGLDPTVQQLHSSQYRRPADVEGSQVLVVGGGNSAAQLAVELAVTHQVSVAAPGGMWFLPARILGVSIYWWIFVTGVLNGASGTRVSRLIRQRGDGIIGRDLQRLVAGGTVRLLTERVVGAAGRKVTLSDGSTVTPDSVLWCTGFRPDYPWLDVPGAVDDAGRPAHEGGKSPVPGLHWIGLPWQTRLNSGILDGVDRDAQALVARLDSPGPNAGIRKVRAYFDRHAPRYDRQMSGCERFLLGKHRGWAVGGVAGRVLEIGVGTGLNLPRYPAQVTVTGVDLSESMLARARARQGVRARSTLLAGDVQRLDLPDDSFDAALSTYTFCSIPDPEQAAREVFRLVRPGGRFVLVEHGPAARSWVSAGQRLLDPVCVRLQGEHLRRDPAPFLRRAGWQVETVERRGRAGLVYRVVARKPPIRDTIELQENTDERR